MFEVRNKRIKVNVNKFCTSQKLPFLLKSFGFIAASAFDAYICLMPFSNTYAADVPTNIYSRPNNVGDLGEDTTNTSNSALKNGFTEVLKPKTKRSDVSQATPYTPIKKQDDQDQIPEIEMFVGESRVFPAPGVARMAVGNGQIMSAAALDNKEIIIFANGVGTSSLFIWNEDGRYQRIKITIVPGDTGRIAREVAEFLSSIPNAKVSIVGDKVIVDGDNLSDAELSKIEKLEKRYPQIVNFSNQIGWEKMVFMDVKVVEFPKSELRELGLRWTAAGGATLGSIWSPIRYGSAPGLSPNIPAGGNGFPILNTDPNGNSQTPSALNILGAFNLGISGQLNLLEQNGKASILAEPQLSARSGSKASFLAGGEIPYSISNVNGVTVQFKPYGIKLDIVPKVDKNGVIRATIESEVSSIDTSVTAASGPALLIRRTNTEFNVRAGETMVLSGLLQRNVSNDIDKVPVLGDLPILGALFRSKRFQNRETELVVFVTPSVVNSQSPGLIDRVKKANERLAQNLSPSPYLTFPLQPAQEANKPNQLSEQTSNGRQNTSSYSVDQQKNFVTLKPVSNSIEAKNNNVILLNSSEENITRESSLLRGNKNGLRVLSNNLIVHEAPNSASNSLLTLNRGSIVESGQMQPLVVEGKVWRNIFFQGINGWVLNDDVALIHPLPVLRAPTSLTSLNDKKISNDSGSKLAKSTTINK